MNRSVFFNRFDVVELTQAVKRLAACVPWRTFLLLGVFLFAQTAALIHAEIHPFHEHTEACNVFEGVEHQTSAFTPVFELPPSPVYGDAWQAPVIFSYVAAFVAVYFSRAPPVSFQI